MGKHPVIIILLAVNFCINAQEAGITTSIENLTYRKFETKEIDGRVIGTNPQKSTWLPYWAQNVSQQSFIWNHKQNEKGFFAKPIPFVLPPINKDEPFGNHNHQPAITWCDNGDLLAIWYTTGTEQGTELTVLASRFRAGNNTWDPSSEFFKASNQNMHGSSIFHDEKGTIYHFNGMAPEGVQGWAKLALLMRTSQDNGVTWSPAQPISSGANYTLRHQVIAGTIMTKDGTIIQACDATWGMEGPTAIHISKDGGKSWYDPKGNIRGIHAGLVELEDGSLMAFGRGQAIDGKMPISISKDIGETWKYKASVFPPIGGGQRLVLKRLKEGPLLFVSFTSWDKNDPDVNGMSFKNEKGEKFIGYGMYAALSFDEGKTWPVRKLLTPGLGKFNGKGWTQDFTATPTNAEHAGYLAVAQTPDNTIHLISSGLHYRFNLIWLKN
jgi:hypothetical protein